MTVTDRAPRRREKPASAASSVQESPPAAVFTADRGLGTDGLGAASAAGFLAELAAHGKAETPLCIGVFGTAGSGKSTSLAALIDSVDDLSRTAGGGTASAFLKGIATARVVLKPGTAAATLLMDQVADALAPAYPQLVAEASHAGLDLRAAAREAGERLNATRQKLDAERHVLDDLSNRHGRLVDTVLFDSAGSRIDAYSRAHRGRIDRSLRRFGFEGEGAGYKELVRDAHAQDGGMSRGLSWVRAFWVYRGQTRLIVTALILFAIAWGIGSLIDHQASLIDALRESSDRAVSTADWLQAHAGWLTAIQKGVFALGVLALIVNVVRAVRFLQPVAKGVALLRNDVDTRRRDLDSQLAHQTHRVDSLVAEAETAAQVATEADRRLAARGQAQSSSRPARADAADASRTFFAALGAALAGKATQTMAGPVPSRLVVALDGFETLSGEDAARALGTAHALLAQPGIVTVLAADRDHLAAGLAETDPALAASRLDRIVQVPYALTTGDRLNQAAPLVRALLSDTTQPPLSTTPAEPRTASALDAPWFGRERTILEAVAPFAGRTPRAVKRFVNLYRVARADPAMRDSDARTLAALAVGLALQATGIPVDAMQSAVYRDGDDTVKRIETAVGAALGSPFVIDGAGLGFATARRYSAGA